MSESDWIELKTESGEHLTLHLGEIRGYQDYVLVTKGYGPVCNSTRLWLGHSGIVFDIVMPAYAEIKRRIEEYERRKFERFIVEPVGAAPKPAELRPVWEGAKAGEFFGIEMDEESKIGKYDFYHLAKTNGCLWQLINVANGHPHNNPSKTGAEAFGELVSGRWRRVPRSEMAKIMAGWGD